MYWCSYYRRRSPNHRRGSWATACLDAVDTVTVFTEHFDKNYWGTDQWPLSGQHSVKHAFTWNYSKSRLCGCNITQSRQVYLVVFVWACTLHTQTQPMHIDLHWLDVPEWVKFKFVSMVHNCLYHNAPRYLTDYCIPISDEASRRHLRSARRHYLVVPRQSLSSNGRQSFAVAGPTAWNSLSDDLRDSTLSTDSFRRLLKTRFFSEY